MKKNGKSIVSSLLAAVVSISMFCLVFPVDASAARRVLPLKVMGEKLGGDQLGRLTQAMVRKMVGYKDITLMSVPASDPLDLMLEAGCEDLDPECLASIGQELGADEILLADVLFRDGSYRVVLRHVVVGTKESQRPEAGAETMAGLEVAVGAVLEMVFGSQQEPAATAAAVAPAPAVAPAAAQGAPAAVSPLVSTPAEPPAPSGQVSSPAPVAVAPEPAPAPAAAPEPASAGTVTAAPPVSPAADEEPPPPALTATAVAPLSGSLVDAPEDGPLVPEEPQEEVTKKEPFYKTWWFWTIVGVAVVGAGTVAGILASQGDGGSGVVEFSPWGGYAPMDVTLYPGRN